MLGKSKDPVKGNPHLENLVNARNKISAHKNINYLLAACLLFSMWNTYRVTANAPVRLVPYQYAVNKGIAEVTESGSQTAEYLSHIAVADLKLYTDWTPVTVGVQFRRFLNRMSAQLHAVESTNLILEEKKISGKPYSQAFFTRKVVFVGTDQVEMEGELVRWEGDIEVFRTKGKYTLSYRWVTGMPYLDSMDFSSKDLERRAAQQSKG